MSCRSTPVVRLSSPAHRGQDCPVRQHPNTADLTDTHLQPGTISVKVIHVSGWGHAPLWLKKTVVLV